MRRPRAFTCSRLRAEPLPPPPRKPLGYLHEEGWAIPSSSPCQCGSCEGDSPSTTISTPPPQPATHGDFLECASSNSIHPWRPGPASPSPACTSESSGSPHVSRTGEVPAMASLAMARSALLTGHAPVPARRIVLFGESGASSAGCEVMSPGQPPAISAETVGGRSSTGHSERKRGSEAREGSCSSAQRGGQSSAPVLLSFPGAFVQGAAGGVGLGVGCTRSASAAAAAVAMGEARLRDAPSDEAMALPSDVPAPASASMDVSLPATATAGSGVGWTAAGQGPQYEQQKQRWGDEVAGKSQSGASSHGSFKPPPFAFEMTSGVLVEPGEFAKDNSRRNDPENEAGVTLEEWKAPESVGTFSLGAPGKESGIGRRRRLLRMRVGG